MMREIEIQRSYFSSLEQNVFFLVLFLIICYNKHNYELIYGDSMNSFINNTISIPLGYLFKFCVDIFKNFGLAILVYTILTKVILIPLNIWVHKNSIRMIKIKPELNEINAQYMSDPDKVSELTLQLYKRENYHPLAGIFPMLIQIPLVLGLVQVIYHPLQHLLHLDSGLIASFLEVAKNILGTEELGSGAQIRVIDLIKNAEYLPLFQAVSVSGADTASAIASIQELSFKFLGISLSATPKLFAPEVITIIPWLSGATAFLLSWAQNKINCLQKEASFFERWGMALFLTGFSLYVAAAVPTGVGFYWILGNVLAIVVLVFNNTVFPPSRYIDYDALEKSKEHLAIAKQLHKKSKPTKEDKARAKADYKRFTDDKEPKQIVFYSESSGFYKYYRRLIEALLDSGKVTIHYVTSDPKDAVFKMDNPRFKPYYIDNNRLITLFMLVDADIMVMTMPDLESFHLKRSYVRKDMEYIYMYHGLLSGRGTLRDHALDAYDTLFFSEKNQRENFIVYAKKAGLPERNFVNFGYSVIDDMSEKVKELRAAEAPHECPRILIAPSWQADNILESCLPVVLEQLSKKKFDITIRPHPQYIRRFAPRLEQIKSDCAKYLGEHCRFEMDFSSNETVYTADVLMTDWSGIAYEYALSTERPVLFIHTPKKVVGEESAKEAAATSGPDMRNLLGRDLMPATLSETLLPTVESFIADAGAYREEICSVRSEYLYNFGCSEKAGCEYILKRLEEFEKVRREQEAELEA